MERRQFVALMAAAAAVPARKTGKVEVAFKSPGPTPNGLQATGDGLWILDAGNNRVYLVQYADGKVLREFDTEATVASGITISPDGVWIANTPQRTILRVDAMTGKTLQTYSTPGAGVTYRMAGDPPPRRSPLEPPATPGQTKKGGRGQQPPGSPNTGPGTGANGLEFLDGKIYMAVPPARQIFCLDAKTWVVERRFNTAGNRTHGLGWEGRWLWNVDTNLNGFFKHDAITGEIAERIQLEDKDPLPHGMTIWQGSLWYCDEMGVICRLKI
jgi:outer membrane protein assembly factor BamB